MEMRLKTSSDFFWPSLSVNQAPGYAYIAPNIVCSASNSPIRKTPAPSVSRYFDAKPSHRRSPVSAMMIAPSRTTILRSSPRNSAMCLAFAPGVERFINDHPDLQHFMVVGDVGGKPFRNCQQSRSLRRVVETIRVRCPSTCSSTGGRCTISASAMTAGSTMLYFLMIASKLQYGPSCVSSTFGTS